MQIAIRTEWVPALSGLMVVLAAAVVAGAEPAQEEIREAVRKGLVRVQVGAANYPMHRDCFSCHHQTMPVLAMTLAGDRGFETDAEVLKQQVEFTRASFDTKIESMKQGRGVPGAATTAGYALLLFELVEQKPDEVTDALVAYLLQQRSDGHWRAVAKRPPFEISPFTATALALRGLTHFGEAATHEASSKGQKAGAEPGDAVTRSALDEALAQGKAWLEQAEPQDNEDRVFQLWGLKAAGMNDAQLAPYRDALLATQRDDGGFAQLADMPSDAYATGQALVVLHQCGLPTDSPAYRKGVAYLLRTQNDDGSWIVETRSRPVQTFFDNGDPGGKSQFLSIVATSWSTAALAVAAD